MDALADSHSALAGKLEADVEVPLREFVHNDREMTQMPTMQGNLTALAKDWNKALQKTEKLHGKSSGNPTQMEYAESDLGEALAQWKSQAPYVFDKLQALDETRVNQLRDVLTEAQTLEMDQVEKSRAAVEPCLNILLNVETQDEIKTFAIKAVSSKPKTRPASMMPSSLTPARTGTASSSNLQPIQSLPEDDPARSPMPNEKEKKGGLRGLKRLGTVMGRKKDKQPAALPSTAEETPERKRPSPFNSLSRLGRSKDSYGSYGGLEPTQEESSSSAAQRPRSPFRMGSEVLEKSEPNQEPSTAARMSRLEPVPQLNGGPSVASPSSLPQANYLNGSHQGDLAGLEPPKPTQPHSAAPPTIAEPPRDNEGFSMPPAGLDPISQAQAEADEAQQPQWNVNIRNEPIREDGGQAALAATASKLVSSSSRIQLLEVVYTDSSQSAPPVATRRAGTVRGRRNDRNSFIPPTAPSISEDTQAIPSPSTRATESFPSESPPAQSSSFDSPSIPQSPSKGFNPALAASGVVGAAGIAALSQHADIHSPMQSAPKSTTLTDSAADNQSIRSGRSLSSIGAQGSNHPDLNDAGLNSSVIETVSARFENGKLTHSTLIGEIALAYNPPSANAAFGHETIRLDNFANSEKLAPNPAFLTQIPEKEGEYSVNLANITRTQLAFKYQLRSDDSGPQVPLLLAPAFKIEPNQTSVIVHYSLHPGFALHGRTSITLRNVMLALTLEGAKSSNCLSRPTGIFSREKSMIYWQLNDLTLVPGAPPEKLLARFTTEGEAKGGSIESKWELSGDETGSGLTVSLLKQGGSDPFADEDAGASSATWKPVLTVKKLVSTLR